MPALVTACKGHRVVEKVNLQVTFSQPRESFKRLVVFSHFKCEFPCTQYITMVVLPLLCSVFFCFVLVFYIQVLQQQVVLSFNQSIFTSLDIITDWCMVLLGVCFVAH